MREDVSGDSRTAPMASATSTMCTTNESCSGCGAYWTSNPDTKGPDPSPPMFATVAIAVARPR